MNRFRFGVAVTVAWLAVMAWVATRHPELSAMKPNEWGDFFAGFFAPLAFLWLVLGYMQQGDDLRLSIEQQRELVEVTRQQVESDREALRAQLQARRDAAKPRFAILSEGGTFSGNGPGTYNITIANAGGTVRNVIGAFIEPINGTQTLLDVALFPSGTEQRVSLSFNERLPESILTFHISYIDSDGNPGRSLFSVHRDLGVQNAMLRFFEADS